MDVVVRQGTAADAAGLAGLRWRWRVEERNEGSQLDRQSFVDFFTAWAVGHPNHVPFVAEVDGTLVGMAWLSLTDRVPSPRQPARRSGDIQSVYVVPERRGQGVGAQLLEVLLRYATEAELGNLTVHSAGTAIGFYETLGFRHDEQWMAYPR